MSDSVNPLLADDELSSVPSSSAVFNPLVDDDSDDEMGLPDLDLDFLSVGDFDAPAMVEGTDPDTVFPVNYDDYATMDRYRDVEGEDVVEEDSDEDVGSADTVGDSIEEFLKQSFESDDFSSVDVGSSDVSNVVEYEDMGIEAERGVPLVGDSLASVIGYSDDDDDVFHSPDDDEDDESRYYTLRLDDIISRAIDMGASDIDLAANDEVAFSILGQMKRIPEFGILNSRQISNAYEDITTHVSQDAFVQELELDTSYEIRSGQYAGRRLRLNVAKSFDNVVLTFRVISNSIPSPSDLGIDDRLLKWIDMPNGLILVNGSTGHGKSVHYNTVIPTPDGRKIAGDIQVGDKLFDEVGNPTEVIEIHSSNDTKHYEITFKNGESIRVAGNHLWKVDSLNEVKKLGPWVRELLTYDDFDKAMELINNGLKQGDSLLSVSKIGSMFSNSSSELIASVLRKNVNQIVPQKVSLYDLNFLLNEVDNKTIRHKQSIVELFSNDSVSSNGGSMSFNKLIEMVGKKRTLNLIDNAPDGFVRYDLFEAISFLVLESKRRFEQIELLTNRVKADSPELILSTRELVERGVKSVSGRANWAVSSLSSPVEYPEKDLRINPYVLGAWIGDGYSDRGAICGIDREILEKCLDKGEELKKESSERDGFYRWNFVNLKNKLNSYGLISKEIGISLKDIPDDYMYSSVDQRVNLLSGIMDTDGWVNDDGGSQISLTNKKVIDKMKYIVSSLGWAVTKIREKTGSYVNSNGERVFGKRVYTFVFYPDRQIYNVARKAIKWTNINDSLSQQKIRRKRHYIESIVEIEDDPSNYICFEVDSSSHLYLCTESFVPTHNSTTLASMIREIQLRHAKKIITVEKPVEYVYGVSGRGVIHQREVGRDTKSFGAGLDSAMRQHPDVILVGEVRNKEEANALLYAADTGHLAFSTMHTNSAADTLNRIKRMFDGDEQIRVLGDLSESARGFVNQLLVHTPDHKGRFAVREVLDISENVVKDLILHGNVRGLRDYQMDVGITMEHELLKAVQESKCLVGDALNASPNRPRMEDLLKKNGISV